MDRVTEPELMDGIEQAAAYARANFEQPHAMIVEHLARVLPAVGECKTAIDLGCGPCDVTARVACLYPQLTIDALDGAAAMLQLAQQRLHKESLTQRVHLIEATLPVAAHKSYDLIIASSFLHHLHEPQVLWQAIRDFGRRGSCVFVADLTRPADEQGVDRLVARYAADEAAVLQRDFRNSLFAAFTPAEVCLQLDKAGLSQLAVEEISDRHLIVYGRLN